VSGGVPAVPGSLALRPGRGAGDQRARLRRGRPGAAPLRGPGPSAGHRGCLCCRCRCCRDDPGLRGGLLSPDAAGGDRPRSPHRPLPSSLVAAAAAAAAGPGAAGGGGGGGPGPPPARPRRPRPVLAGRGARARPAPTTDIAALGAGHWTGNLPKRASTPPRQRDLAEPARRPGDTGRAQRAASRPLRPVVQLPGHVRLSRLAGGPGGLAHWEGTGRLAGRSPAGRPGRRRPQAGGPRTRALRWSGSRPFPRRRCG
jgi:hypothetical protein